LRPKLENPSTDFDAKPGETVATSFESNRRKLLPPVLKPNRRKPSTLALRLNQETCTPCLHMHGADRTRRHWTSQSPATEYSTCATIPDLCTRSLTPARSSSLHDKPHLPPAHYEISKHNSPNEININVKQPKCPRFEFKPSQVNDSSQTKQGTDYLVSQYSP
jgi:hypothetical protein